MSDSATAILVNGDGTVKAIPVTAAMNLRKCGECTYAFGRRTYRAHWATADEDTCVEGTFVLIEVPA